MICPKHKDLLLWLRRLRVFRVCYGAIGGWGRVSHKVEFLHVVFVHLLLFHLIHRVKQLGHGHAYLGCNLVHPGM